MRGRGMRRAVASAVVACVVMVLVGCDPGSDDPGAATASSSTIATGGEPGLCASMGAIAPGTAEPGNVIPVDLSFLYLPPCDQYTGGDRHPMAEATVELVAIGKKQQVLATVSTPVAQDATARVEFTIPDDASGLLGIVIDGVVLTTLVVQS